MAGDEGLTTKTMKAVSSAEHAKAAARERAEQARDSLVDLSHRIHAHPELGYEEEHAAVWLADALADAGFTVEQGICDIPTAFMARAGSGPLHIAICAEYDALPAIGHACGHNIIAAMAVGAGIAAARVADEVGLTVTSSARRPKRSATRWQGPAAGARRL